MIREEIETTQAETSAILEETATTEETVNPEETVTPEEIATPEEIDTTTVPDKAVATIEKMIKTLVLPTDTPIKERTAVSETEKEEAIKIAW